MKNQLLKYDEESHRYFYNGRELMGVSSILDSAGFNCFDKIPYNIRSQAIAEGDAVAKVAEYIFEDTLDRNILDPELVGYAAAIDMYRAEKVKEALHVETPICHAPFGFAGRPDIIYIGYDDRLTVDDFKISENPGVRTRLQTKLYAIAGEWYLNLPILGRGEVLLGRDGTYKRIPHTRHKEDRDISLSAMRIAYFKKQNKLK